MIKVALLVLLLAFAPSAWGASFYCELAALPILLMASDASEQLSPDELLSRVEHSYQGLLEFAGDEFSEKFLRELLVNSTSPEKFFSPVPGRDQRSVALNESLTKLGDWVLFESEDHGLTHEQITARLREVVRVHLGQIQEEQERTDEVREERIDPGRQTTTGHEFVREYRFPKLGEAWRDPDGMVWGDVVRDDSGNVRKMNHADALKYCQEIGAALPSREDFARLREYMGVAPGMRSERQPPGYSPQILPGSKSKFWSSSVHPDYSYVAYVFDGVNGVIYDYTRINSGFSVRCVAR